MSGTGPSVFDSADASSTLSLAGTIMAGRPSRAAAGDPLPTDRLAEPTGRPELTDRSTGAERPRQAAGPVVRDRDGGRRPVSISVSCSSLTALRPAGLLDPERRPVRRGRTPEELLLAPTGLGALLSAPLTDCYGAGITAFAGAAVLAVSTVPFVLLTAGTPYPLLCVVMLVRGLGFGLSIIPAMTAAYHALPQDKIPDGTPQLNALERVGGAIGTAVLTVVLSGQLGHDPTPGGRAGAFGTTFAWVLAITVVATVPTTLLARRAPGPRPGPSGAPGTGAPHDPVRGHPVGAAPPAPL